MISVKFQSNPFYQNITLKTQFKLLPTQLSSANTDAASKTFCDISVRKILNEKLQMKRKCLPSISGSKIFY